METSTLYQYNTYGNLSGGSYDGTGRLSEILKHSSDGIGTLDQANGETIILDGIVYHGKDDGTIRVVDTEELTPYTAIFHHSNHFTLSSLTDLADRTKLYTVKAHGFFNNLIIGNKPKQEKPYTNTYAKILETLTQIKVDNIEGTMVGVYSPEGYGAISGHAFHLHFISEDRKFGGHVLNYETANDTVFNLGEVVKLVQDFPK